MLVLAVLSLVVVVPVALNAIVLVRAVKAVFAVALYRFGTEQTVVGPYSEEDLRRSVGVRPQGVPV